jgi:hypothetical protein
MKIPFPNRITAARVTRPAQRAPILQFVRPSLHRAAARARFAGASLDSLWTPNLLDRLQAPLTRFHD